jgi:hypothetical protein
MASARTGALRVGARTRQVVAHHNDAEQPGRPLYVMVPGGLLALAALAAMLWTAHGIWFVGSLAELPGVVALLTLAPVYLGGVFLFSYGYERCDAARALRLTAVIGFCGLALVLIAAVLCALLASSRDGSRSSSRSSSGAGGFRSSWGPGGVSLGSLNVDLSGSTIEIVDPRGGPAGSPAAPVPGQVACLVCGGVYAPAAAGLPCPFCGAAAGRRGTPPG